MFAYCRNNPVCRIDVTGLYDLDRCEADPLDNELVHEEGGRPGGFQNPSQGPISSPKPSSSPPSSSSNQKLSSPGAAMTLDDAIDTAIDFLGPGYTEAFPTNSGRFVSSDGNRQIRIGVKDIMGVHAGAPHINFDLIGGGRYLSFHLYLMSDVGR